MQSVSSRIWTRVAVFISYDDNNYTTGTSFFYPTPSLGQNMTQELHKNYQDEDKKSAINKNEFWD